MRTVACIVLFLISSISVHAESDIAKRKSAERLMTLMKEDTMMDATYAQIDQTFIGMAKQLGVTDSERPIVEKYWSKLSAMARSELTWDKMKEPIIDIYIKRFTQKELADMVAFYETETGQAMVEKMPLLMKDIMQATQPKLVEVLPKIQTITHELEEELRAARSVQ